MIYKVKRFLFFILFFLTPLILKAQKPPIEEFSRHKLGFVSGVGDQVIFPANYNYEVVLFQFEYSYTFSRQERWNWEVLLQPQYNLSHFTKIEVFEEFVKVTENVPGKEFGLSAGILARTNVIKDIIGFYGVLGAGPHHISDSPRRQAKGFIFSTYLDFGFTIKLTKSAYIDVRPGFRHISNAGTKPPNEGLNTFTLRGGMLFEI